LDEGEGQSIYGAWEGEAHRLLKMGKRSEKANEAPPARGKKAAGGITPSQVKSRPPEPRRRGGEKGNLAVPDAPRAKKLFQVEGKTKGAM